MLKKTTAVLALKIFSNNFLAGIVAILIFTTIGVNFNKIWINELITFLNLLIYCAIIYGLSWNEAIRDRNRVKFGHMQKFMVKGLVAGLIATIPFLITFLIHAFSGGNLIAYIVYLVFNLPYVSLIAPFKSQTALLWMLLLPMPAVSCVGYLLGYREISIMDKLIYKNKKKTPPKRRTTAR